MKEKRMSREERLANYKEAAAKKAYSIADMFMEKHYLQSLVYLALRKRISNILSAKTKAEVDMALKLSEPHFNGGTFTEPENHIAEEELMLWSETSLRGPLNSIGQERYIFLFKKCLPDVKGIFPDEKSS